MMTSSSMFADGTVGSAATVVSEVELGKNTTACSGVGRLQDHERFH